MGHKFTVQRAFVADGVYYTNDNIDGLPEQYVQDRVGREYITRVEVPATALDGVRFASRAAHDEAIALGLTADELGAATASSDNGFTVSDVRALRPVEG